MADEVSPEIIQATQKLLGKHVTKPQLTEKLLKKPPFRFLHDVIVVLVRNGFLKGLYTESELNSDNVKDREAKIAFLNKLITAVKTISGKDLQAKSSKIIAGLDATETNRLLQTIAKLIDDKVDTREYVKSVKRGAKDGSKPGEAKESARDGSNIKKASPKSSLTASTDKLDSTRKKTVRRGSEEASPKTKETATPKTKVDPKKRPLKKDEGMKGEKAPSKTLAKDGKASKSSKTGVEKAGSKEKASPKGESKSSTPKTPKIPSVPSPKVKEDKKADEIKEDIEVTPDSPGEKVRDVPEVRDTLLVPKEDANDVSPRDDSWRPQVLTENIEEVVDKPPSYLETTSKDVVDTAAIAGEVSKKEDGGEVGEAPVVRQPSARPKSARPRSGNNDQRAPSAQIKNINNNESNKPERAEPKKPEMKPVMPIRDFSLKSASVNKERENSSMSRTMNINNITSSRENLAGEDSKEKDPEEKRTNQAMPFRPKSSMLRPPSVRPSSARPGAPRLRPESSIPMKEMVPLGKINVIVENFDAKDSNKDEDEEETVVIQSMPEEQAPENSFAEKSLNLDIPADKGHLVEQILEQMQDGGQGEKAQLEWEQEGSKSRDATTKEITALRASIQALTKTANPLGKLASYLHEDVEAMHSELQTWLNMKRQYAAEIARQRRVNNESNQPLLQQLRNLEESVKREREEIAAIKYNILRNEDRIRHLVSKQITIE